MFNGEQWYKYDHGLENIKIMHNNDMGLEKVKNIHTILTIINNYRQCITI